MSPVIRVEESIKKKEKIDRHTTKKPFDAIKGV